ncbi:MAG TPA: 5'-3' exonuclease H3TH domain-containing protein [Vicinamibacteria bacterium]|nr:5'-3' exonuclease H3TH domain-containing protein [Vicinamibacteria bacterium]
MKVLLVDGTYELFRAFFGAPPALAEAGRPVGAVRGLLATLVALLRETGVTHVACAFDHVIESFRNDLFDGYKTGEGVDPDLLAQFEAAERATVALGIVAWPMVEFEADDALATAALRLRDAPGVEQVVICTPDKDLSQCVVGRRVVCRDRRRGQDRDEAGVRARFGVLPAAIPDWLALVGDSADGIPGVPGWGEKSASLVLARYGTLEAIPDDAAAWDVAVRGRDRLAESLRTHREEAALYRRLATLRTDVPLAEGLADLEWRGARRPSLEVLCREIGFEDLLGRVPHWREE